MSPLTHHSISSLELFLERGNRRNTGSRVNSHSVSDIGVREQRFEAVTVLFDVAPDALRRVRRTRSRQASPVSRRWHVDIHASSGRVLSDGPAIVFFWALRAHAVVYKYRRASPTVTHSRSLAIAPLAHFSSTRPLAVMSGRRPSRPTRPRRARRFIVRAGHEWAGWVGEQDNATHFVVRMIVYQSATPLTCLQNGEVGYFLRFIGYDQAIFFRLSEIEVT